MGVVGSEDVTDDKCQSGDAAHSEQGQHNDGDVRTVEAGVDRCQCLRQ
jgi:hypothetical protein